MQPRSRQVPPQPAGSRSTTAVRRPSWAARMAPTYPPGPLPITMTSNSPLAMGFGILLSERPPRRQPLDTTRDKGIAQDDRGRGRGRALESAHPMNDPVLLMLGIFVCLLGNGFFSGSEIAIISARRGQVEARIAAGSKAALKLKHLQEHIDDFLATVQIGVTVMGTLAGVLGGYLANLYIEPWVRAHNFPSWLTPTLVATVVVGGGIVYTELILGELVPKALALRFTDTVAVLVAPPLYFMSRASRGVVVLLTKSTRAILGVLRVKDPGHRTFVSEEEIKHLVAEGRAQGVLDQT